MKRHLQPVIAGFTLAAFAASASAQYVPSTPARPFPGYINEYLRKQDVYLSQWDIGVNVRYRYEDKEGAGFTYAGQNGDFRATGADNNNSYHLTRVMPRIGYTDKRWNFLVEGRSSASVDDERGDIRVAGDAVKNFRGRDLAENDRDMNVHQAYVFLGNHKEFPVSLKAGRQELAYGDQRLLGHLRWNNNARTFDAVKARYQNPYFGADVFAGGLVYNDNHNFNQSHPQDDLFTGVYLNFPNIGSFTRSNIVEAYLFNRDVDASSATVDLTNAGTIPYAGVPLPFRNPAKQDLSTAGLRIKSKPGAYGPWDYGIELMHQFGDRANTAPAATSAAVATAPLFEVDAYAAVVGGGYTWTENSWQPRLGVIYSYASGDKDGTADGTLSTFQNLFATTHLHYGYMDLNSLQNLHDIRIALSAKPKTNISVAIEGHLQYLDTANDLWYNVAGVGRNGGAYTTRGTSRELGQELDLIASWHVIPSTQIEVGLSHYFAGEYIEQSLADNGGADDADYAYVQVTISL